MSNLRCIWLASYFYYKLGPDRYMEIKILLLYAIEILKQTNDASYFSNKNKKCVDQLQQKLKTNADEIVFTFFNLWNHSFKHFFYYHSM